MVGCGTWTIYATLHCKAWLHSNPSSDFQRERDSCSQESTRKQTLDRAEGSFASVVAVDRVGSAAAMSVGAGRVDAGTGVINNEVLCGLITLISAIRRLTAQASWPNTWYLLCTGLAIDTDDHNTEGLCPLGHRKRLTGHVFVGEWRPFAHWVARKAQQTKHICHRYGQRWYDDTTVPSWMWRSLPFLRNHSVR